MPAGIRRLTTRNDVGHRCEVHDRRPSSKPGRQDAEQALRGIESLATTHEIGVADSPVSVPATARWNAGAGAPGLTATPLRTRPYRLTSLNSSRRIAIVSADTPNCSASE